ncbi:MAG: divalent metal cation transporter [Patescibacteria group bacterium]|nr:divalent metal cation transporter [Patescibacteria group bacterium]
MAKPKNFLESLAEAPAKTLDKTLKESGWLANMALHNKPLKKTEEFWHKLGPGLTTGAADDDPSGIATYSQTGSGYGFSLLWLAGYSFPLMAVIQEMCARIGLVTGKGLAANIKNHFPRWALYSTTLLLLAANIFNIGADLGAMTTAVQLVFPRVPFEPLIFLITFISLFLQIFTSYKDYAKYLKWLTLVLFSYVATGLIINIDWPAALRTAVLPSLNFTREQFFLITGILGTTISPYLFFWQTSQEVEEEILAGKTTLRARKEIGRNDIANMRLDVWVGMFISNLVMFFIIAVCGATLHKAGITNINTAAEAAAALKPLAGNQAYLFFTMGILGTGLLGVPVLAGSASYALSETLGWKQGLHRKLKQAYAFYGVIIIAMLVGLFVNFTGLDPIKTLIYAAVLNGLVAPVILIQIVKLSSNEKIMGHHKNGRIVKYVGWAATWLMIVSGIATIFSLL